MHAELQSTVRECGLITQGSTVVVAASGGADSMALLHALVSLRDCMVLVVVAAHFDHGLRPDSAMDARLVESFARDHGIEYLSGTGDVAAHARERGMGVEAAARELRYRFLDHTADNTGAATIATGHTATDQAETVFMRMLRGSGVRGLVGIHPRRGRIVRPLLAVTREQTREYCASHDVSFRDDPSNEDRRFTRNRVRLEVLPSLRQHMPDADDRLLALARSASDALAAIREETRALTAQHVKRESATRWTIEIAPIAKLDDDAMQVLVADTIAEHAGHDVDLGRAHYRGIIGLCRNRHASGKSVSLPGATVRREHDQLVFTMSGAVETNRAATSASNSKAQRPQPTAAAESDDTVLQAPGETIAGNFTFTITLHDGGELDAHRFVRGEGGDNVAPGPPHVAYLPWDSIEPPLVVRARKPGDRMQPFGMTGHKKISDILIDSKVPLRHRDDIPIVADRSDVLWVVGVATSERTRISQDNRIVARVTVRPREISSE